MAKLDVSPELLLSSILHGAPADAQIVGAEFDKARGIVVLEIVGRDVPESDRVTAVMSMQRVTVRFEPIPEF